jgi:tetratricopeptide (TPR) repeat protein
MVVAAALGGVGAHRWGPGRRASGLALFSLGILAIYLGAATSATAPPEVREGSAGRNAEMGNLEGAIAGYEAAARSGPTVDRFVSLGNALLAAKRPDGAADAFTKALAIDSNSTDALLGRATARYRLGQHAAAAADYRELLRMDPDNPIYTDEVRRLEAMAQR